jgi:nitrate reductase NapD
MTQETNKLENGDMTREEFHVSSLVVLTQPDLRHALAERIGDPGRGRDPRRQRGGQTGGDLEGPSQRPIMAAIDTIQGCPGCSLRP